MWLTILALGLISVAFWAIFKRKLSEGWPYRKAHPFRLISLIAGFWAAVGLWAKICFAMGTWVSAHPGIKEVVDKWLES